MPLRSPTDNYFYDGGVDYALTRDQVLRVNFQGSQFNRGNLGVGAYDLPERAYTTEDSQFGLFLQQNGPIGRRFVLNTRLSMFGNDSVAALSCRSAHHRRQRGVHERRRAAARRHARAQLLVQLGPRLRARHSLDARRRRSPGRHASTPTRTATISAPTSSRASTRSTRARRAATAAASATRSCSYSNAQGGIYIQDDIKVRKGLTITGGVRYEAQTHVPDKLNFAPRAGFTWAPFKSGKTTLRGSWGMFYDWLPTGTYAQTLQIDGFRQRELNIVNPSFPDPGDVGSAPPTNRYLLAEERDMAYSQRLSAGFAQTISRRLTTNMLYSYGYRYALLTGRNLNTPVNGVRPDPDFANVVLARSDGWGRQHTMNASVNLNLGPLPPSGGPGGARRGAR